MIEVLRVWLCLLLACKVATACERMAWISLEALPSESLSEIQFDAMVEAHERYRSSWSALERGPDHRGEAPFTRRSASTFSATREVMQTEGRLDDDFLMELESLDLVSQAALEDLRRRRQIERALSDPTVAELVSNIDVQVLIGIVDAYLPDHLDEARRVGLEAQWRDVLGAIESRVWNARESWYTATAEFGAFDIGVGRILEGQDGVRASLEIWRGEFVHARARAMALFEYAQDLAIEIAPNGLEGRCAAIQILMLAHGHPLDKILSNGMKTALLSGEQERRLAEYASALWSAFKDAELSVSVPGTSVIGGDRTISAPIRTARVSMMRELNAIGLRAQPMPIDARLVRSARAARPVWPALPDAGDLVEQSVDITECVIWEQLSSPAAERCAAEWQHARSEVLDRLTSASARYRLGHRVREGQFFSSTADVERAAAWLQQSLQQISEVDAAFIRALADAISISPSDLRLLELWILAERTKPMVGNWPSNPRLCGSENLEDRVNILDVVAELAEPVRSSVIDESAAAIVASLESMSSAEVDAWVGQQTAAAMMQARRPKEPDWGSLDAVEPTRTEHYARVRAWRASRREAMETATTLNSRAFMARQRRIRCHTMVLSQIPEAARSEPLLTYRRMAFPSLMSAYQRMCSRVEDIRLDSRTSATVREWIDAELMPGLNDAVNDALADSHRRATGAASGTDGAAWFLPVLNDLEFELEKRLAFALN